MWSPLRRLSTLLLGLCLLAVPAQATWSIVCVNLRTREVGVATATCIPNLNLRRLVPVVFVGEGAAAAQSIGDQFGDNRRLIYFSYRDTEETPTEILARLADTDPLHGGRQYGIVNFTGDPVTYTGNGANAAASGVTGQVGDYVYAVQGNILVGDEVVLAAEAAFRGTKGDMGEKLMAAMHAARELGGDGRCSCSNNQPTSCGVPPPAPFKSAHIGTVIVARQGDANGGCNANAGCAKGEYYMSLNYIGSVSDPDPVFVLQDRYDTWRRARIGIADGHLSSVSYPESLPADGVTERWIKLELRDIEDNLLTRDDTRFEMTSLGEESLHVTLGDPIYEGNGRYRILVTSGATTGTDRIQIKAIADEIEATLLPFVEIESVAPQGLVIGVPRLAADVGGTLPFVVHAPDHPHAPYWILGVQKPFEGNLRPVHVLPDAALLEPGIDPFYPAAPQRLDANGRAETALEVPAHVLDGMIGSRLEWTGIVLTPVGPMTTATSVVQVVR